MRQVQMGGKGAVREKGSGEHIINKKINKMGGGSTLTCRKRDVENSQAVW